MAVTRHGVALPCQRVRNTMDFLEHYRIWRIILPPVVVNKGRLEARRPLSSSMARPGALEQLRAAKHVRRVSRR